MNENNITGRVYAQKVELLPSLANIQETCLTLAIWTFH